LIIPLSFEVKSFIYVALNIKISDDYLKNPKIIAKMVNESPENVKAYWFFVHDRKIEDAT